MRSQRSRDNWTIFCLMIFQVAGGLIGLGIATIILPLIMK